MPQSESQFRINFLRQLECHNLQLVLTILSYDIVRHYNLKYIHLLTFIRTRFEISLVNRLMKKACIF